MTDRETLEQIARAVIADQGPECEWPADDEGEPCQECGVCLAHAVLTRTPEASVSMSVEGMETIPKEIYIADLSGEGDLTWSTIPPGKSEEKGIEWFRFVATPEASASDLARDIEDLIDRAMDGGDPLGESEPIGPEVRRISRRYGSGGREAPEIDPADDGVMECCNCGVLFDSEDEPQSRFHESACRDLDRYDVDHIQGALFRAALVSPDAGDGEERGYMTTYTGRLFRHAAPKPEMVDIEDIAHALSNLCHWGGHSSDFFSVAQHSVLVSRLCPPEMALWGLLHDAAEAYYGDMTRPLKVLIPEYQDREKEGMRVVAEALGLPWPEPPGLKLHDNEALAIEARALMPPGALHDGHGRPLNLKKVPEINLTPLAPAEAKTRFLARYAELTGQAPDAPQAPEPQTVESAVRHILAHKPKRATGFYLSSTDGLSWGYRTNRDKAPDNYFFFDDSTPDASERPPTKEDAERMMNAGEKDPTPEANEGREALEKVEEWLHDDGPGTRKTFEVVNSLRTALLARIPERVPNAKDRDIDHLIDMCETGDFGGPGTPDLPILPYLIALNAIHPQVWTVQSCWGHGPGERKEKGDGYLWLHVPHGREREFADLLGGRLLHDREAYPVVEVRFSPGGSSHPPTKTRGALWEVICRLRAALASPDGPTLGQPMEGLADGHGHGTTHTGTASTGAGEGEDRGAHVERLRVTGADLSGAVFAVDALQAPEGEERTVTSHRPYSAAPTEDTEELVEEVAAALEAAEGDPEGFTSIHVNSLRSLLAHLRTEDTEGLVERLAGLADGWENERLGNYEDLMIRGVWRECAATLRALPAHLRTSGARGMKRYAVFTGYNYYPDGGISDFVGDFDTLEEASEALVASRIDWGEIVDTWQRDDDGTPIEVTTPPSKEPTDEG